MLLIFGPALVVAVLLVPYQETCVSTYQEDNSILIKRVTAKSRGHMFLPTFLKLKGHSVSPRTKEERTVVLNKTMLAPQIAAVFLIGLCDYLVFCRWLRRRRTAGERI